MSFRRSRRFVAALVAACHLLTCAAPALANPEGGTVVHGSATIDQRPGVTTIQQQTDRAIINWQSFSNSAGEAIHFQQPAATSVTLNRVVGIDPSLIQGSLTSNGGLFLINPNGIVFGENARIDVGGIVASTLSISDDDFINGNYTLVQNPAKALAAVINKGTITAKPGGFVALVAPIVNNQGKIVAAVGRVTLAAGTKAVINPDGHGLVNLQVETGPRGDVAMREEDASSLLKHAVNNTHIVDSGKVEVENGRVFLRGASGLAMNEGEVRVDAEAGQTAGVARIEGARTTILAPGSIISANGAGAGAKGGDVRAFSHDTTIFAPGAKLQARGGGGEGGDGGLVEVSGKQRITLEGQVDVGAAGGGKGGLYYIDPNDLRITNAPAAGNLDGELPDVLFGDNGVSFNEVSATALRGVGADQTILLEAENSISFDGGVGDIVLASNTNLTLHTRTGDINTTAANLIATGTGRIRVDAGDSPGASGSASLGTIRTDSGNIEISIGRSIGVGGPLSFVTLQSTSGTVDIRAGSASLGFVEAQTISIDTFGAVTDGNGGGENLHQLPGGSITANVGSFGVGDAIETRAEVVSITSGGSVFFEDVDTLHNVDVNAGSGQTVTISAASGNLGVGLISAPGGTVNLTALGGSLLDSGPAGNDINAATAVLDAGTFETAAGGLEVTVDNLTARSRNLDGSIAVNDPDTFANLTVRTNISNFNAGSVTIAGASTSLSTVHLGGGSGRVEGSSTIASQVSYRNDVGNITVGHVDMAATGALFSVNVPGSILDGNGDLRDLDVPNGTVQLTAGFDIGTAGDRLNTDMGRLVASTTSGGIHVVEAGGLFVDGVNAGGGGDVFIQSTGDVNLRNGTVSGNDVQIISTGGNIFDGDGGLDVVANTLTLNAQAEIGLELDYIDTQVNSLTASSTAGSIVVRDSDALTVTSATAAANLRIHTASGNLTLSGVSANTAVFLTAESGSIVDGNAGGADASSITGTVTLQASGAIGATGNRLDVDAFNFSASTTSGGIFIEEFGGAFLDGVTAGGGGDVVVSSSGGLQLRTGVVSGANVQLIATGIFDADGGGSDVVGTTSVLLSSSGAIAVNTDALEIQTPSLTASTTANSSSINVANTGALNAVSVVASGTGSNIQIEVLGGNLTVQTISAAGDQVELVASAGTIVDGNGGTLNITAGNLILTSQGAIATSGDPLDTAADSITASTTSGGIFLRESSGVTLNAITGNGGSSDVSVLVDAGDVVLGAGAVTAGRDVFLTASAGAINDNSDGLANDIAGVNATLFASGGIGNVDALETAVTNATLTSTGSNTSIRITDGGLANLTVNANIASYGTGTVQVLGGSEFKIDGSGVLTSTDAAGNKTYVNSGAAPLLLGSVVANTLTIQTATSIQDGNAGSPNITAGSITLTAQNGAIGSAGDPIELSVSSATASATNGGVFLRDDNTLSLGTVTGTGASSDVSVTVDAGNLTLAGAGVTAGRDVFLTATAGGIRDDLDAGADVNAFSGTLTAALGIGTNTDGIETNLINATLSVTALNNSVFVSDAGYAVLVVLAVFDDYNAGGTVQVTGGTQLTINTGGVITTTDAAAGKSYVNTGTAPLLLGSLLGTTINLITNGTIQDGNGASPNATAGTLNLTAQNGAIGTLGDPIELSVTNASAIATNGGVFLRDDNTLILGNVSGTGAASDVNVIVDAGNLTLAGGVVSAGRDVFLTASAGAINDDSDGLANDISAVGLTLMASGGIGDVDAIETAVTNATLTSTGSNTSIRITDGGLASLTVNANISSYGSGTVQVLGGSQFAIDGSGVLTSTDSGGAKTFVNTGTAALSLGSVVAGTLTIQQPGSLLDANGTSPNIAAGAVTLTISNGVVGTSGDPIETAITSLDASVVGGGLFIEETDLITLGTITANTAGADVTVVAGGNVTVGVVNANDELRITSTGGALVDGNAGTLNLTAPKVFLTASGAIAATLDPLEISTTTLNAQTTTAGGIFVTEADSVALDVISAAGVVELATPAGGMTDANAGAANLTATAITLTARDAIASLADPLDTAAGAITASTVGSMGASPIHILNTGSTTAVSVVAGGSSNIRLEVLAGNLAVDTVTATGDPVELIASAGTITDANLGAANITASALTLTAQGGIGATDALEVAATTLVTSTTGSNASTKVFDGDGFTSLMVTSNIADPMMGMLQILGGTTLTTDGNGLLDVGAAGVPVTLINPGGGFALGSLTASTLTLNVGGALTDGNAGTLNIAAGALSITSAGAVGTSLDAVETQVSTINVGTTNGGVFLAEADGATITSITAGGTGAHVSVTGPGSLTVGAIDAGGDAITLSATAGTISDDLDGTDLTAASASLTAGSGVGTLADPLEVLVGSLTTLTTGGAAPTHVSDSDGLASLTVTTNAGVVQIGGTHTLGLDGSGVLTVAAAPTALTLTNTGAGLAIGAVTAASAALTAAGAVTDANGASPNVVTGAGALSITATAAGAIGTAGDPLETQVGTISASTTNGGVFFAETDGATLASIVAGGIGADVTVTTAAGGLAIGTVDAGGDTLVLSAPAGAITDDGEAMTDLTAATATLTAATGIGTLADPLDVQVGVLSTTTTGANASTHLIDPDGFTSLSIVSNIANYGTGTVQVGGGHTVSLSGTGVLAVNAAPLAFSFRNTAAGTDFALGAVTATTVVLRGEGSILDGNGTAPNVAATGVTFTAGGSVGTLADPIETDVTTITATTTNGGVFLTEDDGATLANVVAGGTGANVFVLSNTGDLVVGTVTAAGDDVTLAAGGRIDDDNETAADVIARTATLSAPGGIGTDPDPVETLVDDLTLTADGLNSSIFASDADGLNNLVISVNIGDFGVAGVQIRGADMLSTGPDGSLTLNAPDAIVTFNNILTSADLVLGVVTGTDVMINSVGAIFDGNGDAPNVIATTAIIVSVGAVGASGDPIEIQVDELTASVIGGGLFVEDVDGLTLKSLVATGVGANVEVTALAGDITVGEVSAGGGVVLVANQGGIQDDGEAGLDIAAVSAVFVSRDGVGTAADPLDVSVTDLGVLSSGLNGRVAITDPDGFRNVALDVNIADFAAGGIALIGPGNLTTTATGHLGGTLNGTDLALTNRAPGANFLLDALTVRDATVVTEGSILDGNSGAINLVGRNVVLDLAGSIGTGPDALETSIDRIDAFTVDGGVHLNEASGLRIGVIDAGGAGRDVTVAVGAGDVALGRAFALGDRVAISADGGNLLDDEADLPDLVARRIDLTASGSIGTGLDGIETEADQLTAVAFGGSVVVREADDLELVEARATDDVIVVNEAGGILLGLVSARDDVLLRTPGSILDANSDALNVEGDVATLEAGGSIGTATDKLETRLTEIEAQTQAGEVAFDEADGINLRDVVVGGGFELAVSADGDIGLGSVVVDAGVTIDAGGSIVATAPGNNLISTAGTVMLDAGGVIGTSDAPIDAQVAGTVAVDIGSAAPDGRSSAFTASVSADQLTKLNTPPGSVEAGELDVDFQQIDMDVSMTQPQTVFRSFAALGVIAMSTPPPASLVPGVVILDGGTRGLDGSVTPSSQPFTLALGSQGERPDPASGAGLSGPGTPRVAPAGPGGTARAKTSRSLGEYRAAR